MQESTRARWIALCLVVASAVAYAPSYLGNDFVLFDDDDYVTENPHVLGGLTWASVKWAFTSVHSANWHPLTWLSHMLDVELFGTSAPLHHAMNVALHCTAVCVLFGVLRRARLGLAPAAFVSAVFAVHPTHVESVAWAAERKDVLCALFWFLSLGAWVAWTERGGKLRYAVALVAHALALLAKPMAVSLPLTLLLIDVWPLGRARRGAWRGLLIEKLPFVALTITSSIATWLAQHSGGAVVTFDVVPFADRWLNALVSYGVYLWRFVWPVDLAALYPYPFGGRPVWQVALAACVLVACAVVAWRARERRPAFTVGFAWFFLTLVPVIGIAQVGLQANADRYTYVPYVGVAFMVVALCEKAVGVGRRIVGVAWTLVPVAWTLLAVVQTRTWSDTITLFRHAVTVTDDNFLAYTNLGHALVSSGAVPAGTVELETAVRLRPDYYRANRNLGLAYYNAGRYEDAQRVFESWIAAHGEEAEMLTNLATVRMQFGDYEAAAKSLARALELDTHHTTLAQSRSVDIGLVRADWAEAAKWLEHEVELEPDNARLVERLVAAKRLIEDPQCTAPECSALRAEAGAIEREIADTYSKRGKHDVALAHAARAVELAPADPDAHVDLGRHALDSQDLERAESAYRRAAELSPTTAQIHNNLGYVQLQRGELEGARATLREALRLDPGLQAARENLASVEQALARR